MKHLNKVKISQIQMVFIVIHFTLTTGIQASSSTSAEPAPKKRKASDEGPAMKKTAFWYG